MTLLMWLGTLARVAEWQTRTVQVRVTERSWEFNSPRGHDDVKWGRIR